MKNGTDNLTIISYFSFLKDNYHKTINVFTIVWSASVSLCSFFAILGVNLASVFQWMNDWCSMTMKEHGFLKIYLSTCSKIVKMLQNIKIVWMHVFRMSSAFLFAEIRSRDSAMCCAKIEISVFKCGYTKVILNLCGFSRLMHSIHALFVVQ